MENHERSSDLSSETSAKSAPGNESLPRLDAQRNESSPALLRGSDDLGTNLAADVELFPIRTVSSLTGVNSITLRAWERRYGLVRPLRTPTGHRLYRRDEIDLIHRVVALLDKGISISQVKRVLSRPQPTDTVDGEAEDRLWTRLRHRMSSAVARFDDNTMEDIYHEALGIASVHQIMHQLLVPLWDELGNPEATADDSLAEAHFFRTYLRNKLAGRLQHRSRGITGPRLLGACLPGEQSDVGLLLFALTAHEVGLRTVLLGADVPLGALNATARQAPCDAVVLDATTPPAPGILAEQMQRLTADLSIPVFVRGTTSIHRRDQIVAAGAVPLGNDLIAGAKRVVDALSHRTQQ